MQPTLRIATPQDAPALLAIYEPYVRKTFVTFEYEVPGVQEFEGRIAGTLERFPYLVAADDQRILGYAYAGTFHARPAYDWAAETSIYVDEGARGMHVGRLLYAGLEAACLAQNMTNLEACIAYPDEGGSVGFHERLGYRMVGRFEACGYKLGAWRDMVWMEKHIAPHDVPPRAFEPFPQVAAEVAQILQGIGR